MKIYLIEEKDKLGDIVEKLGKYGEVIHLYKDTKDIHQYTELFDDKEEKLLVGVRDIILGKNVPDYK